MQTSNQLDIRIKPNQFDAIMFNDRKKKETLLQQTLLLNILVARQ